MRIVCFISSERKDYLKLSEIILIQYPNKTEDNSFLYIINEAFSKKKIKTI